MNSDTGFSCHQLDKDDVYQIDNSKSSCALFMIQGQVNLDLGEFYEGEMEQGQMLYIPQSIKAQIESITGSRCILLFWDKHISTCDKLFLSSLSIKENDTDTNDVILPIKKPLMNVLESVNLYLNARLLCRHMHLLKQQELLLVLRGFYTKKELRLFFPHQPISGNHLKDLSWITIEKQIRSRNLPTCTIYQSDLLTESFILVLGKAPINGYRRKKRDIYRK